MALFGKKRKEQKVQEMYYQKALDYYYGQNGLEKNEKLALYWAQKVRGSFLLDSVQEKKLELIIQQLTHRPTNNHYAAVDEAARKAVEAETAAQRAEQEKQKNPFQAANAAREAGNYAEAVRLYTLAAEQGNAAAAYNLSYMYYDGEGVEQDDEEGYHWLLRSAELGDADAMYDVADMIWNDEFSEIEECEEALSWAKKAKESGKLDNNVLVDALIHNLESIIPFMNAEAAEKAGNYAEAIRQYQISAEMGESAAAWNLAIMYYEGEGVTQNDSEGFRWRLRSAELGDADAMFEVADAYYSGEDGAEKDDEKALYWAKKAKESGCELSVDELIEKINQSIADTKAAAEKAARKAAEEEAAQKAAAKQAEQPAPQPEDPFEAAVAAYQAGNYEKAIRLFQISAEQGDVYAALFLAGIYSDGEGVPKSEAESFRWQLKAAEMGNADTMYSVAISYFQGGNGVEEDDKKALFWAKKAKESGKLDTDVPIDRLIRHIESKIAFDAGVTAFKAKNYSEAVRQYTISAEKGSSAAAYNVAQLYHGGLGVKESHEEGFRWMVKAAEMGSAKAMYSVVMGYYLQRENKDLKWDEKALYWAKRAKRVNGDLNSLQQRMIDSIIEELSSRS